MGMGYGIIFSFVCAAMLLALSFFVLLTNRRSDSQWVKIFGYVVAALLWIAAAIVFGAGLRGPCPMMRGDMKGNPMPMEMRDRMDNKVVLPGGPEIPQKTYKDTSSR